MAGDPIVTDRNRRCVKEQAARGSPLCVASKPIDRISQCRRDQLEDEWPVQ
jgi:hypothetical protein